MAKQNKKMTAKFVNKADYLKRYTSSSTSVKTKKRKEINHVPRRLGQGLKILDDDVDLNVCLSTHENSPDDFDESPFIAEFVDERPNEIKQLEQFRELGKWKLFNADSDVVGKQKNQKRHDSDSDSDMKSTKTKRERELSDSESDLSPPRKNDENSDLSPMRKTANSEDCDLTPPRRKKRNLNEVIYRDKTGKRRDLLDEKRQEELAEAKKEIVNAKYKEWNKGLKQKEMQSTQIKDLLHEVNKPLARYKDDVDLDEHLREVDREGDPMLGFLKKKKATKQGVERPQYVGPEPPPNRFNIRPGYRWDGVDRSNGFERQYFSKLSEKKAHKDMAYKWSVEDM